MTWRKVLLAWAACAVGGVAIGVAVVALFPPADPTSSKANR